jgi:hypothetical protein
MDKSECRCETTIEARPILKAKLGTAATVAELAVVTRTKYLKHGHTQVVARWLQDDGNTYVVTNELTLTTAGVVLRATLYFDRRDPESHAD